MRFDYNANKQRVFDSGGYTLTRLLTNSWNYSADNQRESSNKKAAMLNEITLRVGEIKIQEEVNRRGENEWASIYCRRYIAYILNFIFLSAGFAVIVLTNLYEDRFSEILEE